MYALKCLVLSPTGYGLKIEEKKKLWRGIENLTIDTFVGFHHICWYTSMFDVLLDLNQTKIKIK